MGKLGKIPAIDLFESFFQRPVVRAHRPASVLCTYLGDGQRRGSTSVPKDRGLPLSAVA